jgi:cyclase
LTTPPRRKQWRRAQLLAALIAGVILVVAVPAWRASGDDEIVQAAAPHTEVGAIHEVAHNLYVVPGGGGNTAVFVTKAGVLLVDTKHGDRFRALLDQVRTVTDKPITHVINSHRHTDHSGGNDLLDPDVEIVIHESNLTRIGSPSPTARFRSFRDKLTLFSGEDEVEVLHFGPAHTDGDAFVVFRAAGVMHAGDVFPGRVFPTINIAGGGDAVSLAAVLDRASTLSDVRQVITGHGAVMTWNDLLIYRDLNNLLLGYVRDEMKSGRDKYEVFRTFQLPERFASYSTNRAFNTMDEFDRAIRPRWKRMLPGFIARHL